MRLVPREGTRVQPCVDNIETRSAGPSPGVRIALVPVLVWLLSGCAAVDPSLERGQFKTVAYSITVESNEPGTKIEVNGQVVGVAPVTLKVFGDRDGTFHNFGSDDYTVRAYPPRPELYPQSRIYKTGTFGVKDDKVPQKILFDFSSPAEKSK